MVTSTRRVRGRLLLNRTFVSVSFLIAQAVSSAYGVSVTLPLRWLDGQAYVANVSLNGEPALLQVGTFNQETWVACSRYGDRDCSSTGSTGGGSMSVENGFLSFDFLNRQTLSLTDAASLTTVQFRNLSGMLRAVYNATEATTLPLVGNETLGVMSLGPPSPLLCGTELQDDGAYACSNFSVYLSSKPDGAGSFVKLGGDTSGGFNGSVLASMGSTTRYSMPVRSTDEQGWRNKRWYLSLLGVRFGDNKPMYPRVYSSVDTPGADAKALVSLNHATLQMPPALHSKFMASYLSACQGFKTYAMGWYYECDASVMNSLPRLSLYVMDKVFYLDPTDYTQASSVDATKVVVLVASSGLDDSWVLGASFLRKFPSIFSPNANTIEVFCATGSSCSVFSGSLVRQPVNPTDGSQGDEGSGSSGYVFVPRTSRPPSYQPSGSDFTTWDLWIAKTVACLVVVTLMLRCVRVYRLKKRGNRRNGDRRGHSSDTGTMASERDLEEAKEDLRRMLAEEAAAAATASRQSADFVRLQSPSEAASRSSGGRR